MSQVLKFEPGQRVIYVDPDTFARREFKIATVVRSQRGHHKDLLEDGNGFNARAEFCSLKR